MKNFDWSRFSKRIAVKAPLEKIYQAWTTSAGMEQWFLKAARYYNADGTILSPERQVQSGMTYEWEWFLYSETEKGKILFADGISSFQFSFAGECKVEVRLSESYGYSVVELEQTNIPQDDISKERIRIGCSSGWSFYLVNLKSVYEGGLDLRSKDERLRPMVNN